MKLIPASIFPLQSAQNYALSVEGANATLPEEWLLYMFSDSSVNLLCFFCCKNASECVGVCNGTLLQTHTQSMQSNAPPCCGSPGERQHVSCCSSGEQAPMLWLHLCARLPALTCLPPQMIFTVCLAMLEQLWSAQLSGPLQWDLSSRLGEVSSPAELYLPWILCLSYRVIAAPL